MKHWFAILLLTAVSLWGDSGYDPLSYDYGFTPLATAPSDCGKIFANLDLAMLRAASAGQVFGTEYLEGDDLESIGEVKRLYFPTSYDFGFRLMLGYALPGDQWAATATWFYFSSEQKAQRTDGGFGSSRRGGAFFIPGINGVASVGNQIIPIEAHGKWKLTFNQLDLEGSRDFLLGPAFTLKPSVGVRLLSLNEHVDYQSTTLTTPETDYLSSNLKGSFYAFGPVIGFDNFLELGFGLGAFLTAKGALLVAHQDQKQSLSAPYAIDPFDLSFVDFKNDMVGVKGAIDFAAGLEWRMPVAYYTQFFYIRAVFENHLIFNAFEYPRLDSADGYLPSFHQESHDFALFGFVLSFGFTI
jgi:hypothetical protein